MIKRCLILIYLIGIFILGNTTNVSAKVCFLPDGNCEAGKATYSSVNNTTGCEYKDENAAKNGLGECQETYQSGMCYYRRCKMSESDCMKKANASVLGWLRWKRLGGSRIPPLSAIPYKCVVCKDGCWQLIRSSTPVIPEYTCRELGYKVKEDCTAEYVKFSSISLIDKNGNLCGKCENLACMEMGGLKTEGSCAAGEKFVYANKIDGFNNKCGTCEAKTEPDPTPDTPNNGTYTITVNDYGEFNSGAGEYIFQRSVTYDSPDASIDIISGYNCNKSNCSGPSTLGGTFTKSVSNRMDTIQSHVGGNGGDYQLNLSFTGCSIKINGTTKSIRSVSPCESTTIQMPNGDKYNVEYSFNGSSNGSKKSCSDYNLETSSDCKYGYTLLPSKEHPTDDNSNKCGTCVKNVTFSANTIDCGGLAQNCEYFYPCTQDVSTGKQCYKCITSLYKKFIVIWIDSDGKIKYQDRSFVPYSDEYVVLTTMNDYSSVTDDLGEMEGWSPTSKFDNTIGQRRGFYELYIKQTHPDSTSQCYLSTDENLEIWKRGNPGVTECEKKISGYTSGNTNYAFGVGSGGSTHLSNADIIKMFPNKKINGTSTGIDIAGTTGSGETIISKYVWYRITNVKPGDVIDIYPRCYRDVNVNKGVGGRCYFGWKGQNSSLGNYTNCKKLN